MLCVITGVSLAYASRRLCTLRFIFGTHPYDDIRVKVNIHVFYINFMGYSIVSYDILANVVLWVYLTDIHYSIADTTPERYQLQRIDKTLYT